MVSRSRRGSGGRGLVGGQGRVARVTLVGDQLVPGSLVLIQSFQVASKAGPLPITTTCQQVSEGNDHSSAPSFPKHFLLTPELCDYSPVVLGKRAGPPTRQVLTVQKCPFRGRGCLGLQSEVQAKWSHPALPGTPTSWAHIKLPLPVVGEVGLPQYVLGPHCLHRARGPRLGPLAAGEPTW